MIAGSADEELIPLIREGLEGRVHSVFDRAANLIEGGGGLITLLKHGSPGFPNALYVDENPGSLGLEQDERWRCERGVILFSSSGRRLDVKNVKPICLGRLSLPRGAAFIIPDKYLLCGDEGRLLRALCKALQQAGRREQQQDCDTQQAGGRERQQGDCKALQQAGRREQQQDCDTQQAGGSERQQGDCKALQQGNWRELLKALVGLGEGLTPLGDDMLMGAAGILASIEPHPTLFRAFREELEGLLHRTTLISAAYLTFALDGRLCEPAVVFAQAFLRDDAAEISKSFDNLCAWGHTSGRGIAAGIGEGLLLAARLVRGSEPDSPPPGQPQKEEAR
jgi:hypothetical protein